MLVSFAYDILSSPDERFDDFSLDVAVKLKTIDKKLSIYEKNSQQMLEILKDIRDKSN